MFELKVRITYKTRLLGTSPNDPEVYTKWIASKAPDPRTIEDEILSIGIEKYEEKDMTVFRRDENGNPFHYGYQWKGFFKEKMSFLRRVPHSASSKITAFLKGIDGLVFVRDAEIHIPEGEEIKILQRPLRIKGMNERVALATSEVIPAGSYEDITITCFLDDFHEALVECLNYGEWHGTGQWRSAGNGTFTYEVLSDTYVKSEPESKPKSKAAEKREQKEKLETALADAEKNAPVKKRRGRPKKTETVTESDT
jgi:hypothetical protein